MAATNLKLVGLPLGLAEPSTPVGIGLDDQIFYVCKYLDQARGDDVPFAIVHALNVLRKHAARRAGPHPTQEQCDRMTQAALNARLPVVRFLGEEIDTEGTATRGMDALMGLIVLWGETERQRGARHPHTVPDLLDHAGIFRNDMRSAGMLADIEARAHEREVDQVTKLCPTFVEHAY